MERLTIETSLSYCDIADCLEIPCEHGNSCDQRKCYERLREYERSGLAPEEVAELAKIDIDELVKSIIHLLDWYDKALNQGKLIRNPIAWALFKTWKEADKCLD